MGKPRITVIIPTRERSDVLQWTLKTVVAQAYENLEIIVSDNHSQDATREVVGAFNDPRISYVNTGRRVSMSANWEFALSKVTGEWAGFLGDDDGLLPGALNRVAETIQATGIEAVRSSLCAYMWPSDRFPRGYLSVPLKTGVEIRNSRTWLTRAMKARAHYTDLPVLYHSGFVRTAILTSAIKRHGPFFRSLNPDIYSGCAVASLTREYVFLFEPLAIAGTSRHANGQSFARGEAAVQGSPANRFVSEVNLPLHPSIPSHADGTIPLFMQALMYESYLQTSHLREEVDPLAPQEQLALVLCEGMRRGLAVREWAQQFAETNRLDFAAGLRRARVLWLKRHPVSRAQFAVQALNKSIVLGGCVPLNNVYEASIAAAEILAHKLDFWRRMVQLARVSPRLLRAGFVPR